MEVVSHIPSISTGTLYTDIHERLGLNKLCVQWLSHSLPNDFQEKQMRDLGDTLHMLHKRWKMFLSWDYSVLCVTKPTAHFHLLESKEQSKQRFQEV